MRALSSAAVLLVLAACGGSQSRLSASEEAAILDVGDDTAAAEAGAEQPATTSLPERVSCYFGELMVGAPGQKKSNQGALLVKLTMDPAHSRMVEDVWSFPLYERYAVTRTIDGSEFTLRQDDGTFTGSGELSGQPWLWSSWSATTRSADAQTVVKSETRFEDGALVTRERVLNAAGQLEVEVSHSLNEVPLDECNNMFAKARAIAAELRAKRASK